MNSTCAARLLARIQDRGVRAGIIGLGYVGLPLAVEFARNGIVTTGIDLDARKVAAINSGVSYIPDVPSQHVAALQAAGRLTATSDYDVVSRLDTINICVPTPLRKTKDPDMSYIVAAVEQIAARLHPGMLIILESTTYPGTTEEIVQEILERTGYKAGEDFLLAFSPERVDPGNPHFNTRNVPKVIGGLTPACSMLAAALYRTSIDTTVQVSSTRVAEMVKLLENTFRAVNIGLVNEIALMCDRLGVDVWEVIEAASTKPFGFMPFYPGPGLGGHCIPVDPFYLSWKAKQSGFEPRFIELAGHVNGSMPHRVVTLAAEALNTRRKALNGSRILVAGVAYKPNIDDIRESPALDVMGLLHAAGADVSYMDPHVPFVSAHQWGGGCVLHAVPCSDAAIAQADCVVILTNHANFDYEAISRAALVVDTRNALGKRDGVFRLGAAHPEVRPLAAAAAAT